MLRNSDSHNEKYGWNSIPNSIPKNTLGGSRFNLEINGIFRCLDISFVSLPPNDVTRTSSWLSKSSLFATIDENGDEPRPHLQWWMHFWAEMPTAKSTRGMATTAQDEEPNRRESQHRRSHHVCSGGEEWESLGNANHRRAESTYSAWGDAGPIEISSCEVTVLF